MSAIAQMLFHRSSRLVPGLHLQSMATVVVLLFMTLASLEAATFTVDVLTDTHDADPGDGYALDTWNDTSLRAAVEEANALSGTDLIIFDVSLEGETIDIGAGEMVVSEDLEITGFSAPDQVELNGLYNMDDFSFSARAFLVEEGVTLGLEGLKLVSFSHGEQGGAVLIYGALEATECDFIWCSAVNGGGAISTDIDGNTAAIDLYCQEVTFFDCHSGSGGAVQLLHGDADFSACLFEDNDTDTNGGALMLYYDCTALIDDCDFFENFATGNGGAIGLVDAEVWIYDYSHLEENVATSDGGAIWIGPDGRVHILNGVITDNECLEGGNGGGVYVYPYAPHEAHLCQENTTISGNTPDDIYPAP